MKNKKLIIACILVAVMLVAFCLAACDQTPNDEHKCEHQCEICHKCKDASCEESVCKEKCDCKPSPAKAPVITVTPSSMTIHAGDDVDLLLGVSATDEVDGTIKVTIADDGNFDKDVPGTYVITYKAVNSAKIEATATRTIVVEKALSALALEVQKNILGEQKWQGTKLSFANALYKASTAARQSLPQTAWLSKVATAQTAVWLTNSIPFAQAARKQK